MSPSIFEKVSMMLRIAELICVAVCKTLGIHPEGSCKTGRSPRLLTGHTPSLAGEVSFKHWLVCQIVCKNYVRRFKTKQFDGMIHPCKCNIKLRVSFGWNKITDSYFTKFISHGKKTCKNRFTLDLCNLFGNLESKYM